ncbi:MAG: amidohydrolase [Deltaproteobacteria bacterium]|nr:amidohydrolase [Deltaproteobacteria bacterium]MBW1817867.1 amidohydrolase [Deltaproteobacteria bacterium]MBW2283403.1 amidohydrolase [Deltaproteobacteria bacterium]
MIIDFHTHVFPKPFREDRGARFSGEPAFASLYASSGAGLIGASELLDAMDRHGIQRAVIFGFPWEGAENYRRNNDYILEAVQRHPDRLTGFCCFSPLAEDAPREAERCLSAGMSGVGELAVYGKGLSRRTTDALKDVMAVCARFDTPFLLHTNEPVGHAYPGKTPMTLAQIYRFLKAYPDNRIILAHWGGGLFFYALMKKEVRDVLKNVWVDTAASPFLYTPEVYRIAGEIVGFDKILFGSDFPLIPPDRYFREMTASGITPRSIDMIKGLNAAALLGIKE